MSDPAKKIKSMKLYTHIDRVYNELGELGKADDAPLSVEELAAFDQLHYHGTDAVDASVAMIGIDADTSVLEIGSGIGGPARYIASVTGAQVTALELQHDQNDLASRLTARCGLSANLDHVCGDFLTHEWDGHAFDSIVSWLALYHIPQRGKLMDICHGLLNDGGAFYTEDLCSHFPFDDAEWEELSRGLFARHLPDFETYQTEVEQAGFKLEVVDDMTESWTQFTRQRLAAYRAARERHVRVHGAPTVDALDEFYALVCRYFDSGKLGGIRLYARKT